MQLAALPVSVSIVQALPSLQLVLHELGGSQVSPGSITPFMHVREQSLSLLALQPAGQQPSPVRHCVTCWCRQAAVQFAALPVTESIVQDVPSSQAVGHEPAGSQVSPGSTTSLPQLPEQSLSTLALQPPGQHPSPLWHCVMIWLAHATLQLRGLPVGSSIVHALPSSHCVGQDSGGSQVSPGSTAPLLQLIVQSLSLNELQVAGQQPSSSMHMLMR